MEGKGETTGQSAIMKIIEALIRAGDDALENVQDLHEQVVKMTTVDTAEETKLEEFYKNEDGSSCLVRVPSLPSGPLVRVLAKTLLLICKSRSLSRESAALKEGIQKLQKRIKELTRTNTEKERCDNRAWLKMCRDEFGTSIAWDMLRRGREEQHAVQTILIWDLAAFFGLEDRLKTVYGGERLDQLLALMNQGHVAQLAAMITLAEDESATALRILLAACSTDFVSASRLLQSIPDQSLKGCLWAVIGLCQAFVGLQEFALASFVKAAWLRSDLELIKCFRILGYVALKQIGMARDLAADDLKALDPGNGALNHGQRLLLRFVYNALLARCEACISDPNQAADVVGWSKNLLDAAKEVYKSVDFPPFLAIEYPLDTLSGQIGIARNAFSDQFLAANIGAASRYQKLEFLHEVFEVRRRFSGRVQPLSEAGASVCNEDALKWLQFQFRYTEQPEAEQLVCYFKYDAMVLAGRGKSEKAARMLQQSLDKWCTGIYIREQIDAALSQED